jgi:hypothetical protein
MVIGVVVTYCVEQSPVPVMARLALQRILDSGWVDALLQAECGAQYTRELFFSTTVELMSVVAIGLRPSVPVAAKACKDLTVSVQKLYDKIRRTPPLSGTGTGAAKRGTLGRGVDSHDEGQGTYRVRLPLENRRRQAFAGQRVTSEAIAQLSGSRFARSFAGGV